MPISLSGTIREKLREPGQSRVALVRAMGYSNLNKGLRFLDSLLLRERCPEGDQPNRLARALALERGTVEALARGDRALAADEARLERSQDPRYRLTMRLMPAVYSQAYLPGELPLGQALEHTAELCRSRHRCCCLNAPSGFNYWLSQEGTLDNVTYGGDPYMRVGGQRFVLKGGF